MFVRIRSVGQRESTRLAGPRHSPADGPLTPSPAGPCAVGTCEVGVGDVVTVPEAYGLGPIEITEVAVAVAYGSAAAKDPRRPSTTP